MIFFAVTILVQIACVVHLIRNNRPSLWLWAIILLPIAGSAAYVVVEILPGLGRRREVRAVRAVYSELGERIPGAEAQCRQAALLIASGRGKDAVPLLEETERRARRLDKMERRKEAEMYDWAARTLADLRGA
jgi:hypothetical protein